MMNEIGKIYMGGVNGPSDYQPGKYYEPGTAPSRELTLRGYIAWRFLEAGVEERGDEMPFKWLAKLALRIGLSEIIDHRNIGFS